MVIFRNHRWRGEKRNTTLWLDDNFVGTELNLRVFYGGIAEAGGLAEVRGAGREDLRAHPESAYLA